MTKFKALSFKFGRFFTNTHPQTPSAREGAFLGTSQVEFSKKFTHFLQGVDSSLRYAPLRMTSCLAILTAFLFAPNLAQAEQSGWFVGVQGGYNKLKWDRASDTSTSTTTFSSSSQTYYACSSVDTANGSPVTTCTHTPQAGAAERTEIRENILGIDASSTKSTTLAVRDTEAFKNPIYNRNSNTYINSFADAIDSVLSSYWYLNRTSGTQSTTTTSPTYTHAAPLNDEFNGFMAGLLGGYKHFFGGSFGLRFYGLLDFGYYTAKNKSLERQLQSYSASFNADMLYNLLEKDDLAFGVFAGLSAGWMQYMKGGNRLGSSVSFGVNLGLRLNLSAHHSLELFSKINALGANSNFTENSNSQTTDTTTKSFVWFNTTGYQKTVRAGSVTNNSKERIVDSFAPSAQVGLRYIYSF